MTITCSILMAVTIAGCASNLDTFKKDNLPRAAFELSCPADQVTTTEFDYKTIGVAGCGKKAVYVYVDGTGWVNNTSSATQPGTPSGPRAQ